MEKILTYLAFLSAIFAEASAQCFQKVCTGYNHSAGLKTNGTLWVWGNNTYGQLGDGSTVNKSSPMQVGTATDWASVTIGDDHTIALKTDGSLWAWGANGNGQLGDGTTVTKPSPMQVGTATDWASIYAKRAYSIAIKTNGTLWAWGRNNYGQLGDGTTTIRLAPVQIGTDTNWHTVGIGMEQSIAIKTDGTLWAWGRNNVGQLGDGYTIDRWAPIQVGTATNWQSIATGVAMCAGIQTDGSLWSWGTNDRGELGNGSFIYSPIPRRVGTANDWQSVFVANVGGNHNNIIALKTNGSLWIYNSAALAWNRAIDNNSTWLLADQSSGNHYILAIKSDSTLWAQGQNSSGQLGDATTTNRTSFINIPVTGCSTAVGVAEETALSFESARLFPNPTQAGFTLQIAEELVQNAQVNVLNSIGQLIYTQQIQQANTEIQLHNQPVGMYLVQIRTANNQVFTHKLLKQ